VDGTENAPDRIFTVASSSKRAVVIEGAAFILESHTCSAEVHVGLADADGRIVFTTPARRFVLDAVYVRKQGFGRDATCGFRARVDTGDTAGGRAPYESFS
jgi:hypothetical protein